eukprot:TRINITY_DN3737_c0_g1_i3.p1 TRINITY_DN3737_c0_g1~~TRINITY_DN3737_c0_g1_i3.p1  ORF type:complete len:160 (+),score=32.66 TRINITY_DN3737_c0_g1_i3:125-604(+)
MCIRDSSFGGHTHHYQRSWPVFEGRVARQSYEHPRDTVYIQGGIAGVTPDRFELPARAFEAFRDESYSVGWGRLCFYNSTQASFSQLFAANGSVLDSFTIVRDSESALRHSDQFGAALWAVIAGLFATGSVLVLWFMHRRSRNKDGFELVEPDTSPKAP